MSIPIVLQKLRLVRPVILACLLMGFGAPAFAQTDDRENLDAPGLDIEAVVGLDGKVDRSTSIPISLLINNHSNTSVEGEIWITDPWQNLEIRIGEVFVSEGSSRRLNSIQALRNWNECYVELRSDNRTLWRRTLGINTGNEFSKDTRYAIIVNNSTRHLDLPKTVDTPIVTYSLNNNRGYRYGQPRRPDSEVQVSNSTAIESLNCKAWQLPNHPAPLMVASSIVFPDGVITDDLNAAQWNAISEWMCRGGQVFVHEKSDEIVKELLKSAPLNYEPPVQKVGHATQQVGLGLIYEYSNPIFNTGTLKAEQKIAASVATHNTHSLAAMAQLADVYYRESGRADRTRSLIIAFFGIYTLLSGVVSVVFFRRGRRGITVYIGSLVAIACVCSALLGGSLRYSRGDVHWVSVTRASNEGAVQYARFSLQSAGSRNSRMAVKGNRPDLQQIASSRYFYSNNDNEKHYPPFTRQPSTLIGNDDTFQLNVPITPWGRRELHATAFNREFNGVDIDLQVVKTPGQSNNMPNATLDLTIKNKLPVELKNAQIFITSTNGIVTRVNSENETESAAKIPDELVSNASYRMMGLGSIAAGKTHQTKFSTSDAGDRVRQSQSDFAGGTLIIPSVSQIGVTSFWLVAELENPPCLEIDSDNSDFVSAEKLHFFVQKIEPQDIQQLKN